MRKNLHTAFLAGIDPIIKLSDMKKHIHNKYKGVYKIDTPKDQRKGFMFVHFLKRKNLEDFMKYGKIRVFDRDIMVKPFLKGQELKKYQLSEGKRRLFVKNIPPSWDDQNLYEAFGKFGHIQQAYIVYNPRTRKSRCFGYILTKDVALAEKLHEMGTAKFGKSVLLVKKHTPSSKKEKSHG